VEDGPFDPPLKTVGEAAEPVGIGEAISAVSGDYPEGKKEFHKAGCVKASGAVGWIP
jgi:hypothetical protein